MKLVKVKNNEMTRWVNPDHIISIEEVGVGSYLLRLPSNHLIPTTTQSKERLLKAYEHRI